MDKNGKITQSNTITSGVSTTKTVLSESLDVLNRTNNNGSKKEEASTVTSNGTVNKMTAGSEEPQIVNGVKVKKMEIDIPSGTGNTDIHSHQTYIGPLVGNEIKDAGGNAREPGPYDPGTFRDFSENVIVGNLGLPRVDNDRLGHYSVVTPYQGAVFYDSQGNQQAELETSALQKIIKN